MEEATKNRESQALESDEPVQVGGKSGVHIDASMISAKLKKAIDALRKKQVGEAVKPVEVMLFARKNCRTCFGTGIVGWRTVPVEVPREKPQTLDQALLEGETEVKVQRRRILCGCGIRPFAKKHSKDLVSWGGQLFWKNRAPGAEPGRADATRIAAMIDDESAVKMLRELGIDPDKL